MISDVAHSISGSYNVTGTVTQRNHINVRSDRQQSLTQEGRTISLGQLAKPPSICSTCRHKLVFTIVFH